MRNGIDVNKLEREYHECIKMKNSLLHFHKLPERAFEEIIGIQKAHMTDIKERDDGSIQDTIESLLRSRGFVSHGYRYARDFMEKYGNKEIHKTMGQNIYDTLNACAGRMVIIRELVDYYEPLDQTDVQTSAAVVEAARKFRSWGETNIGWRNNIGFVAGVPGTLEVSEKEMTHWNGSKSYNWDATIAVDHTYISVVKANNIEVVDIAGRDVVTIWAEEVPEHDLKDDDVKLFKAKVAYTKVPRELNTYSGQRGDAHKIINIEDKHIAIQPVSEGRDIVTTGKDASWAIRTMRRRMKKKMMEMMGV